jgi:tripartite-type tricarboxylate transporter receptor subunit TctC
MAQTMAKYMGHHIPGNPAVIVQHQPGAGGLVAANNVYNVLPKDGTILFTPNGGMTKRYVLGEPEARYDPAKWTWLGGWGEVVNDCTVWKTAPATTIDEAKKKEVIIGTIDAGSNTHTNPLLINNILGTKFKLVSGYGGGSQIRLAMERNEVHGFCGQFEGWKSAKPEWLRDGKLAHIVQLASRRSADMPNTPLLSELARNDEERQIFQFIQSGMEDRAVVLAPGVPADRVAAMTKAIADTFKDPQFVDDATKQKFEITPFTSEEVTASVKQLMTLKPDTIAKVKKAQGL